MDYPNQLKIFFKECLNEYKKYIYLWLISLVFLFFITNNFLWNLFLGNIFYFIYGNVFHNFYINWFVSVLLVFMSTLLSCAQIKYIKKFDVDKAIKNKFFKTTIIFYYLSFFVVNALCLSFVYNLSFFNFSLLLLSLIPFTVSSYFILGEKYLQSLLFFKKEEFYEKSNYEVTYFIRLFHVILFVFMFVVISFF